MKCWLVASLLLVSGPLSSGPLSASTPGDAANRGGHPDQAAELYRRGADQGDAQAALNLGLLINSKRIGPEKYGTAGTWFLRGCDLGSFIACHNVGVGYEYGPKENDGLEQNFDKARDYYLRAAERGYMQAQYNLGSLYSNGYVTGDVDGLMWLLIAQRQATTCAGSDTCGWVLKDPPGHIQRLKSRMNAKDIELAETQAAQWRVKD